MSKLAQQRWNAPEPFKGTHFDQVFDFNRAWIDPRQKICE